MTLSCEAVQENIKLYFYDNKLQRFSYPVEKFEKKFQVQKDKEYINK